MLLLLLEAPAEEEEEAAAAPPLTMVRAVGWEGRMEEGSEGGRVDTMKAA